MKNNMDQDILKILYTEDEIKARVESMGRELYENFQGRDPLFVGVLNGCFMFMADLVRATGLKSELEFIGLSSYRDATKSSGVVRIVKDLNDSIVDKNVIVIEDVVDTGRTLNYLLDMLRDRKPKSLALCSLLDKPSRRVVEVKTDYIGFTIPDKFVVGYGLDYAQKYRNLPYIAEVEITE